MKLNYTRYELARMSDERLGAIQQLLGQFLGTTAEEEARRLNRLIQDEKAKRNPPIFGGF